MRQLLFLLMLCATAPPCLAQDSTEDMQAREQWLRYSNWEGHQSHRLRQHDSAKEPAPQAETKPVQAPPLPANPGAQSVEPNPFSITPWYLQSSREYQRNPDIPVWQPGMGSSFRSRLGPGYASYFYGFSNRVPPGAYPYGGRGSRLGPQIIQTGPSPSSGNYYQPPIKDPSASGNYYN